MRSIHICVSPYPDPGFILMGFTSSGPSLLTPSPNQGGMQTAKRCAHGGTRERGWGGPGCPAVHMVNQGASKMFKDVTTLTACSGCWVMSAQSKGQLRKLHNPWCLVTHCHHHRVCCTRGHCRGELEVSTLHGAASLRLLWPCGRWKGLINARHPRFS